MQRVPQPYNIFYFTFLEKFHVARTQQTWAKSCIAFQHQNSTLDKSKRQTNVFFPKDW